MTKNTLLSLGLGLFILAGSPQSAVSATSQVKSAPAKAKTNVAAKTLAKKTTTPVVSVKSSNKTKVITAKNTKVLTKVVSTKTTEVKTAKGGKAKVVETRTRELLATAPTKAVKQKSASAKTNAKQKLVKQVAVQKAAKVKTAKAPATRPESRRGRISQAIAQVSPSLRAVSPSVLRLESAAAFVIEQDQLWGGQALYQKNSRSVAPIASVTKLMTAMVSLDAKLPMDELLTITDDDVDVVKRSASRLKVGTTLSREEMMRLALMSSENRAAHALGRTYPGGERAFIAAMNFKAAVLGMKNSRFYDPTGLNSGNVATAEDLARMVNAAYRYPDIRRFTTTESKEVEIVDHRVLQFRNTNPLVKSPVWDIGLSKTGFIKEAGHCLVMQANIGGKDLIIVLLDSAGKYSRVGDSNRIKQWLERKG